MTFRWSAIQSALNTAAHPTTPEPEALSALRKANELLGKSGRSVGDLILKGDGDAPSVTPLATLRQIERLENDLARCRTAGIELRDENTRLQSGRAAYEAKIRTLTDELRVVRASKPRNQPDQTAEIERLKDDLTQETARADSWQSAHAERERERDQAMSDLRQERKSHAATQRGLAAIKAQPVPSGPTIQQLQHLIEEKHRIIQYLSRILDKDLFERLVDQGRNHANRKPLKKNTWPTNPDEILGDFEWGTRGKPKKAKPY